MRSSFRPPGRSGRGSGEERRVATTRRQPVPVRVPTQPLPLRPELSRLLPSGRSLLAGFGILALAAGSYLLARGTPLFAIDAVEVTGGTADAQAQVRRALRSEHGKSLLAISGESVLQRLEGLPTVRAASFDRGFPHTLRIRILPERPVAVLRRGGDSWLVSGRGRVIERLQRGARRGLPRIWLRRSASVRAGEQLADAGGLSAARALALLREKPVAGGVRGAVFGRDGLRLALRSGVVIRFGPPTDVALKLAVAQRVVPLLPAGTAVLDLTLPERPVADPNPQVESGG